MTTGRGAKHFGQTHVYAFNFDMYNVCQILSDISFEDNSVITLKLAQIPKTIKKCQTNFQTNPIISFELEQRDSLFSTAP